MQQDHLYENGPEAASTVARLTERQAVFQGEGGSVAIGQDGPTFCVMNEGGTLLDFMDEDEVSELDRRAALSVRRFATEGERDAYIEAQPWQEYVRERGWAVRPSPFASSRVPASFELHLRDDANGGYVHLVAHPQGDTHVARFLEAVPGRRIVNREMSLLADEWARFEAELRLLDATDHEQVELLDGLMLWRRFGASTYSEADPLNTAVADLSYFVPRFDSDADLLRLLLAVERLIGRVVWPGLSIPEGLDAIPDKRDRLEHLVLAAVRRWAEDAELGQLDPGELTETQFEKGLLPHLDRFTPSRKQVGLKGDATTPPVLSGWPGVGPLDIELSAFSPPVWLELKWAKAEPVKSFETVVAFY